MSHQWLNENVFYRYMSDGIVDSLQTCPVLAKADYEKTIEHFKAVYGYQHPFWQGVYWSPTGGSTSVNSQSVYFPYDIAENKKQRQVMSQWLAEKEIGVLDNCNLIANLFTGTKLYRSLELVNDLASLANVTALPIGSNCTNAEIDKFVQEFQPDMLAGPPVTLADYANFCLSNGLVRNCIKRIWYATNALYPAQLNKINLAFNSPEIYSLYGSAETGPWAYHNAKYLSENEFIIADDICQVEIINLNHDGFGDVLVSNKIRQRFPVIRYSLGDVGRVTRRQIAGEHYHVLELKGRSQRWLSFGDDQIELNRIDALLTHYVDWQVIQSFKTNSSVEQIHFNLLAHDISDQQIIDLQQRLEKLLNIAEYKQAVEVSLACVSLDEMIKSPLSQKVIKLVDYRQA